VTPFGWLMTTAAAFLAAVVSLLWLLTRGRRYWVRGAGCPGCAYRNQGPCTCKRKCINPECEWRRDR
jgi:hypothetical protein